ncbi:MAG: hypothetical protein CFK52_11825 [Chloracidobacterium sp. CP2_5A]|nr:MAG: hypothetical protein CFK52_11825 [Chloracidobacterium sp. CP2_5A]
MSVRRKRLLAGDLSARLNIVWALAVGAALMSVPTRPAIAQSPVGRVVNAPPRMVVRLGLSDGDRGGHEVTLAAIPFGQTSFADVRVKGIATSVALMATQPAQAIEFEFRAFRNEQQAMDVEVGAEAEIPAQPQPHLPYQISGLQSASFRPGHFSARRVAPHLQPRHSQPPSARAVFGAQALSNGASSETAPPRMTQGCPGGGNRRAVEA